MTQRNGESERRRGRLRKEVECRGNRERFEGEASFSVTVSGDRVIALYPVITRPLVAVQDEAAARAKYRAGLCRLLYNLVTDRSINLASFVSDSCFLRVCYQNGLPPSSFSLSSFSETFL